MSKTEFTKEQIEYLKEEWIGSPERNFIEFANSLLKPETKKIVVEIEEDIIPNIMPLNVKDIEKAIKSNFWAQRNPKVTELPEVFSRFEVETILLKNTRLLQREVIDIIDNFLSERSKK